MNESCYVYESHTWMGHVTHMTESCHICECVRYWSVSVHMPRQLRRSLFLHSLRSLSRLFFLARQIFFVQNQKRGLHNCVKKTNKLVVCTRKWIYWIFVQKFVGLCFCIRCEVIPGILFWKKKKTEAYKMCQNKPMNLLCAQENRSIGYFYKKL